MAGKKNKHKPTPKPKKSNFDIGDVLTTISGLAASLMAIYGFVKAFKDDTEGFVWLIPLGVIIWLIILWQMFQKQKMYAYTLLILTLIAIPVVWNLWQTQVQIKESKIVVLVAKFDGPEEKYGVRDELIEKLKRATKDYPNIEIATTEKAVNSIQSSEYARELGDKEHADIVIWAWYRPTENPNITIHIENLSPKDFSLIQESETYQPTATIADLESFEIQKQIGAETANLVNFLAGYLQYQVNDYQTALVLFDQVMNSGEEISIVNKKNLFLFSGLCHYFLTQHIEAIKDFDQAIQLDPNFAIAYYNRGSSYQVLGQYEHANQDYDRAIQLNPNFTFAYNSRGASYHALGQYERAIQDYDKAIQLDPNLAVAYYNRGTSYHALGQYERAIQDYDRAIQLDPNFAIVYYNRGTSYQGLGKTVEAETDFQKYEELTGKKP
jgi:Flp pilus assembly protein TadD